MIPEPGEGFVRLSPLKLLLDPMKAVAQAVVPLVIALVGISQSDTRFWPFILPLGVLGPLVLGALPWLTTHYRLTGTQIQVRSGILNKRTSTAPLDRVRSVDLEASLLHRILGLQKVQIGTGVDDDRITLDADATSLRVIEGTGGAFELGDDDIANIHQMIDDEVLMGQEISFRSTSARPEGDGRIGVEGELTVVATTKPIAFELAIGDDGALTGTATVTQTDWGMKPYSALFGALKVADEVEVMAEGHLPPQSR